MGKVCDVCQKRPMFGNKVSHSERKSSRMWAPNVQRVRVMVGKAPRRLYVCTSCLRSGKITRAVKGITNVAEA